MVEANETFVRGVEEGGGRRHVDQKALPADEVQDNGVSYSTAWPSRLSHYTPFPFAHWLKERLTPNM